MEISKGTVGVVAVVCLAAGAGGAYVATHSGGARQAIAAADQDVAPAAGAPAVEQTEALVAEEPEQPQARPSTPAPVARAVPVRPSAPARGRTAPEFRPAPAPASIPAAPAPIEAPAPLPAVVTARVPEVAPRPPEPLYEDLVLAAQSVIGLQIETSISSETARVEDEVVARVTRDVRAGDRVAIPAGARAHGEVTFVERGGRLKERARLAVRFTSIVLADGTRVPIETEPIYREGDSVRNENTAKIGGGAIGGAILGGIFGGAKGAAIGGSIGAGAGTAAVVAGGRNAAALPSGSPLTVRIERPVTVTVER